MPTKKIEGGMNNKKNVKEDRREELENKNKSSEWQISKSCYLPSA